MNRRRAFFALAALGGSAALRTAGAQAPARIPRVGILHYGSPANFRTRADAFKAGMEKLGYVEGKSVRYEWRAANGQPDLLQAEAEKLARGDMDVLVSSSNFTTRALHKATRKTPIVMVAVDDPVAYGFARSLAHSDTNLTGVTASVLDQAPRFVELLSVAVGRSNRFAALMNPANSTYRAYRASLEAAARKAGTHLAVVDASSPPETERAFDVIDEGHVDGVIVMSDGLFYTDRFHITELAATARRPVIYPLRAYVEAGGLMSYGPDLEHNFTRAAAYVDRILKGASPRELAIEPPAKYELVVNRAVARSLGITLPPELLKMADKVIGKP